ncbi:MULTISPECIES: PP2C family serine/threonine-protein phosphatase [Rhodococcus]|uniref:Serine/threonine protein phosphatase PstP n=1 Tax=Rhodococcus oxybenzonivorans TaxID=1990687 RepID=A0AAE4V0Y5_9NOCA|nr:MULTISPECIES: PP2C family serine/threonine-protein phosphatase [Rhodococcus]MDV7246084.1 PP2C family serine/threonine-protein phosphatase [Rhodococcus oxybenzonivorans]MDV7266074.1 PP2C family serine/threonine-protein phosphatase [Rhodococcus oxybenzonivorans]MDV7277679.1 PP2C family serine/threonine-protein phosphatase [Rhodococcus oxybenzonivorans]MDV7337097.1 PP2C family serine/threonine-protein phosphatase [Rhodococcus oxybenzonivorans]MDV7347309.1 PP2C family serine/threonine-protein p
MTLVLRYAARSDRGLVRSNNEDSVYAGARLLALADGMGGHAAGEVASQLMIAALAHLDDDEPGEDLLGKLEAATREGNDSIADHVEEDPELDGMGTTLTAILFSGSKLGLVHIGDSRAYLLRDNTLTQITRDDTFVQSLVDEGRITAEQAHTHPQRSLIMRALTGNEIEPTLTVREARAGDRYLLCSDGLSDVVSDETIENTMREGSQDECADRLIELALRSGGPDNVTVVVADVIDLDYGQSHPIVAGAASADDDDDAPPPNTAAGRAAAMRPPRATPKRVVPQVEEAPTKKTRHRMWWAALALGLIVVVAVAAFVGRALIRNNYYVGADGERVTVLRGVPGSVLGYSLQEANLVGCVTDTGSLTLMSPTDSPNGCTILQVDDLQPSAREQVRAGLPSGKLDDVRNQMARLADNDLLPVCESQPATTTTTPVPVPTPTPEPPPATTPAPPATPETAVPPTPTPTPTTTQVPGQNCRTAS